MVWFGLRCGVCLRFTYLYVEAADKTAICKQCLISRKFTEDPAMKKGNWTITNGIGQLPVCDVCAQPIYEGHVDCSCDKNHPENCFRPTYSGLEAKLENARRIAGQNSDLYAVAEQAIQDVRHLVGEWEADYTGGLAFKLAAKSLETIITKYEAAMAVAIK